MRRTRRITSVTAILISSAIGFLLATPTRADVWCTLSNFSVDSDDHKDVYLSGNLSGQLVSFIIICGTTNGQQDCESRATDRRLAVALAAQAQGKALNLFFSAISTCAQFQPYMTATDIQVPY